MTRIAFLGLGAMGSRMARRLLEAGHELHVWNRSEASSAALAKLGAHVAKSPRGAADGAEVVWSMVYDDAASRQVWLDPSSGALERMASGTLAIESSTLSTAWITELGDALARAGHAFVDAPVAGSRPQADAGQLIFMAGGHETSVAKARPLFDALGGAVHHVGPAGSGAGLKLAVNALFATQVLAMAELLGWVRKAGLDPETVLDALRAMPVTSPAAGGAAMLMLAENYSPQAPVELIAKDLGYALQAGSAHGAAMPLVSAVKAQFDAASAAGHGQDNVVAVAKLYR